MLTVVMTHIDTKENRYRFYRLQQVSDTKILVQWGRMDTPAQEQIKTFDDTNTAQDWIKKQVKAKQRRGYKIVPGAGLPELSEPDCPWCQSVGPVQMDGFVAVAYPSHMPRTAQDVATRSRWWALVDHVADLMGDPDVILPAGAHSVAYLPGELPEDAILDGDSLTPPDPVAEPTPETVSYGPLFDEF